MTDYSPGKAVACASEPIHLPAAIQPHAILLVAGVADLRVCYVAGAAERELGHDEPVGSHLAALLGTEIAARAAALVAAPVSGSSFLGQVTSATHQSLDVSAFITLPWIAVELEPAAPINATALAVLGQLELAAAAFERTTSLQTLCDQAAASFRELTGFDRVMIYRFDDNGSGQVVAEARRAQAHRFLNHHFPASDIPPQARALYLRNLARVIPDAAYHPAGLRPAWTEPDPLDMSDSNIRSVSPTHLQYLRNMGVRASASISIVRDGALWGLVACHHETPLLLPYDVRAACRVLAGGLARQIRAREEVESYRQRIRFRGLEDDVIQLLSREGALEDALAHHLPQVSDMMDADGVAIIRGPELAASGTHPAAADIRALAAWRLAQPGDPVTASFSLRELDLAFARFQATASGMLAVLLSAEEPWVVLWFRAEQVELVNWAGDPHELTAAAPDQPPSPRASFAPWPETVRGRSRRWTLADIEAARRLRVALLEMRQTRRLKELNNQLNSLLREQAQLVEQKDYMIGEVNHRVQNSLQLVSSFLQLQARSSGNPELRAALDEARHRLTAVALVHRRLYAGSETRVVDGARYIDELCADTLAAMGPEWGPLLSADLAPVLISTDRAVIVGLVLTELLININKYAYAGAPGPIELRLTEEAGAFTLLVADRGTGILSARRGFGSRMIDGLVTQIGGRITQEGNHPGLRITVSAPL